MMNKRPKPSSAFASPIGDFKLLTTGFQEYAAASGRLNGIVAIGKAIDVEVGGVSMLIVAVGAMACGGGVA